VGSGVAFLVVRLDKSPIMLFERAAVVAPRDSLVLLKADPLPVKKMIDPTATTTKNVKRNMNIL
jgi:hypothetical protein